MRRMVASVLVALAILVMGAGGASAAEAPPPIRGSGPVPPPSPRLALGLSIVLPAVGYGMMAGALAGDPNTVGKLALGLGATLALAGPSGGNLYTGRVGHALAFTGGRLVLATVGLAAVGAGIAVGDSSESDYDPGKSRAYLKLVLGCVAGIVGLSVWESVGTYRSAKAVEEAGGVVRTVSIAPLLVAGRQGLQPGGLSLAGAF